MQICRGRIADLASDPAHQRKLLIIILSVAALCRVAAIPLGAAFEAVLPDTGTYRTASRELLNFQLLTSDYVMPGYPLLVALSGGLRWGQTAVDLMVSLIGVWAVARLACEITKDHLAGLVAGAIWALHPSAIFYSVVGLTESLFVTMVVLGFLANYRRRFVLGSFIFAASLLVRPALELLAPILIVAFVLVVHHAGLRVALKQILVFLVVYVALMTPWWLHNYAKYHQFVRLNLASGVVLYSGNNPMNRSGGGIVGEDVDFREFDHIRNPVERDKAMRDAAVRYMGENPERVLELAWLKFLRLWQPWPYAKEFSSWAIAAISTISFTVVLGFAIAGLVFSIRTHVWWRYLPILLFVAYLTAVHIITIASLRYRFPIEPFLIVLGAPVMAQLTRRLLGLLSGKGYCFLGQRNDQRALAAKPRLN